MTDVKTYVYVLGQPIDLWDGWVMLDQAKFSDGSGPLIDDARLEDLKALAKAVTRWEGDIAAGPYVIVLPNVDKVIDTVVAWKQDNDGTTFVFSTKELYWLNPYIHVRDW